MKNKVPVVVIGGSLNSLGVVRSLSRGCMPIYVIETTRLCPGGWSRHCRQFVQVSSLEGRPLIEALKALAQKVGERAVLLITDDRAVNTVSAHREEIETLFYINLPAKNVVRFLADKTLFQEFAEKNGLPVPKSVILKNPTDLLLLNRLTMPVVIKPSDKAMALNGKVERAERADSLIDANRVATAMLKSGGETIAQEWIEGPDKNIFFTLFTCDSKSKIKAIFSGQKIVCNPPRVGNTAICVAANSRRSELEALTRRMIELVNYTGLGSVEFKLDERTNQFVIVEPTVGRTDWQEEIATLCGVNIPLIAYQTEIGSEITEPSLEALEVLVAWRSSVAHKPQPGDLRLGTEIKGGYFLFNDPLPGLFYYGYERFAVRVWNLLRKILTHPSALGASLK